MHIKVLLEKRVDFIWSLYQRRVGRVLLWHTGADRPGHLSFTRQPTEVIFVRISTVYLDHVFSLAEVENYTGYPGAWYQLGNWLYIRIREQGQLPANAESMPWYDWWGASYSTQIGLSNDDFHVSSGVGYKTGIVSSYKIKTTCDDKYGVATFSRNSVDVLLDRLKEYTFNYIGTVADIEIIETGKKLDRQFVETISGSLNKLTLSTMDFRASLKSSVVDQLFDPREFTAFVHNQWVTVMDKDVQKKYKLDAIGHCVGVPGECMNGDAKDRDNVRYYWFGYGRDIDVDEVEVRMDSGWKPITGWWKHEYTTTIPNGEHWIVTLIAVPAEIVHPPESGNTQPDYDCTPREVRCSGIFHVGDIANPTRPYDILKYLFNRYSQIAWSTRYINEVDMQFELAKIESSPIGIVITEPTKLFEVVGQLQGGSIIGWKLTVDNYLICCRMHDPNRPIAMKIKCSDIKNVLNLKYDFQGKKYVSDLHIKYAKVWSEADSAKDYSDWEDRQKILSKRASDVSSTIETLLYEREDAKKRYEFSIQSSKEFTPRITDIELVEQKFTQWYNLKEYDIIELDLSEYYSLIKYKYWYVMGIEYDMYRENVKIALEGCNGRI